MTASVSAEPPLCLLALGVSQFAAKVFGRRFQQPVGVHQAQVPHVAAGRVQQLVEDHVRRLALEEDGGRVDGDGLVGVQGQVAAVGLELSGVDEHSVRQAAADVLRLGAARLQLQIQLLRKKKKDRKQAQSVSNIQKILYTVFCSIIIFIRYSP